MRGLLFHGVEPRRPSYTTTPGIAVIAPCPDYTKPRSCRNSMTCIASASAPIVPALSR